MRQRKLGPFTVSAIGLGCMNLSHAYSGFPPREDGIKLLNRALDVGYTHLDTAALYGATANESLVGDAVSHRRSEYTLATKCGLYGGPAGVRGIDGRPETIKRTCDESLQRLKTDVIDVFYLHRMDKNVPIEDSVGAMADMVRAGKVRAIGLSEVGSETVRRAHAVHPIAALQTEYSLWTRNPEIKVLETCRELGITFVAFSPLAREFLCGTLRDMSRLDEKDIRRTMPRFSDENFPANLQLLDGFAAVADEVGCSMAQLALAWVLAKGDDIVPIPGTKNMAHMEENAGADAVTLDAATVAKLDDLIHHGNVIGGRYNAAAQSDVGTEEFAA